MKLEKSILRTVYVLECIHLAILSLCLSMPFACILPEGSLPASLLWGFGAAIPVQLIRAVGYRVERKPRRILLCLAVLALAILVPNMPLRRVYYGLCCAPILLAALVLNRPGGKLVLTVPKIYHFLAPMFTYGLGVAANIPQLTAIGMTLAVLMILVFFFHMSQTRLLTTLRMDKKTGVSLQGILRMNRLITGLFAALFVVAVVLVPWLMSLVPKSTGETIPRWTDILASEEVKEPVEAEETGMTPPDAKPIDYTASENVLLVILAAFFLLAAGMALYRLLHNLANIDNSKSKHNSLTDDGFVIERLEEDRLTGSIPPPEATAYDKRIRRRYSRLILRRTRPETELDPLAPKELEQAAHLPGDESGKTVHELYETARYAPFPVTKEEYQSFKAAAEEVKRAPIPGANA